MNDRFADDGRTSLVDTANRHLFLEAVKRLPANRATFRRRDRDGPFGPVGQEHFRHLGDDVSPLLHHHGVANAHIFATDFIEIVEGGPSNSRAAEVHGVELGDRRHRPGAADLKADLAHHGLCRFGRVFVGDGPAGRLRSGAQLALLLAPVDLDNDAVDLEVECVAPLVPFLDESFDAIDVTENTTSGIRREPQTVEQRV